MTQATVKLMRSHRYQPSEHESVGSHYHWKRMQASFHLALSGARVHFLNLSKVVGDHLHCLKPAISWSVRDLS